jgi:hypothetical protein
VIMSNDRTPNLDKFNKAETADFLQKLRQEMAEKADPMRSAIMDAICRSHDARVAAIRRKSSFDQLRALVDCMASAIEPHPTLGDGTGQNLQPVESK